MKKAPFCCKKNNEEERIINKLCSFLCAISQKNRLRIICMLHEGEKCVCDICKYLSLPQNLTSHHLKELETKCLVSSEKRGAKVFYKINESEVKKYIKLLDNFLNL